MTVRANPVWFPGRFRDRLAYVFSHFNGPVLVPGDPGYDDETARFNTVAGPVRPAVVVGARDADDVRKAIDHARSAGLRVAVQATGHGLSAPVDGALLINTRRMTGLSVDPATRTVRVGAGVRWGQVVDAAAGHGLAPPNGSSPLVGAVGYTLGGGLPVLGRTLGWAADRVRSLELVTADGTLRTLSPYENVEIRRLGGALAAVPDVPNAIDHRTAAYSLTTIAFAGTDPKPPLDPADPSSTGLRFRNFLAGPQAPALAAEAYTPSTWTRLTSLKSTHDPHDLFL
ncbi:FAD-binding oxidoreductase [Nonomuraea sp. NPDC049684]|uniref:FAD-binding oxidoreductase n=1 Tax=Nonomuraea sp. NPDC049684 TaxID=3364356 RepID=UPI003787F0FE